MVFVEKNLPIRFLLSTEEQGDSISDVRRSGPWALLATACRFVVEIIVTTAFTQPLSL
jgi:hypothetical protein